MPPLKGPGEAKKYDGSPLRIGIVHARWNTTLIDALVRGTIQSLRAAGVRDENIVVQTVPGSYELPYAAQKMFVASQTQQARQPAGLLGGTSAQDLLAGSMGDLAAVGGKDGGGAAGKGGGGGGGGGGDQPSVEPFDAIVAIGALIKGETMHFEYISEAVSQGLMRVQLELGVPVVFGLLTLLTEEQGLVRAGIDPEGKGHNHGEDWGSAAVELGVKRRGWNEGRFVE